MSDVCPDCNNGGNWRGISWVSCLSCNGTGRAQDAEGAAAASVPKSVAKRIAAQRGEPYPFTNIDHLGRGDHNPPIGSLATAIESLQPLAQPIAQQGVAELQTYGDAQGQLP